MRFHGLAVLAAIAIGCSGSPYRIPLEEPEKRYEPLGYSDGIASGQLVLGVIPISYKNQIERATQQAIDRLGGDALREVTVQQTWRYGVVLYIYRVRVTGLVVREVEPAEGE